MPKKEKKKECALAECYWKTKIKNGVPKCEKCMHHRPKAYINES